MKTKKQKIGLATVIGALLLWCLFFGVVVSWQMGVGLLAIFAIVGILVVGMYLLVGLGDV